MLVWSTSECPGCGATVSIGVMSLCASCPCGMYYVDVDKFRGWYFSRADYERGDRPIMVPERVKPLL